MAVIRWIIGRIILFFDFIFSPSKPKRTLDDQKALDDATAHLSLYQLPACPFCVKVRREMKRQGLNIALRNINQNESYREELIREGGKRTVPCLKIEAQGQETKWLYESSDIVQYLAQFTR
ncbi:glutaredoxin family protein [Thalassotalea agarivorans]|uniref:Glutaredoxin n=1 Tax=Thalassotalea agarivorans TaxID=349064 RepID=A0A1H9ZGV0_THASX|nr:glutaredoxin [Thalassotalea agarivorans]SES80853.1 Glutaredoxin [Thalassotalea agarivorans]